MSQRMMLRTNQTIMLTTMKVRRVKERKTSPAKTSLISIRPVSGNGSPAYFHNQTTNARCSFISHCKPREHQQALGFLKDILSQLRPNYQGFDSELLHHIQKSVAHLDDLSSQANPKRVALQDCMDEEIRKRYINASRLGLLFETVQCRRRW